MLALGWSHEIWPIGNVSGLKRMPCLTNMGSLKHLTRSGVFVNRGRLGKKQRIHGPSGIAAFQLWGEVRSIGQDWQVQARFTCSWAGWVGRMSEGGSRAPSETPRIRHLWRTGPGRGRLNEIGNLGI